MVQPVKVFLHPDDVVLVVRIFFHQLLKQSSLQTSELVVNLCISVYLYGNTRFELVVYCRDNLRETTFA